MKKLLSVGFVIATSIAASAQTPVFVETFDELADGTSISTENTDLTYVRIGGGGGVIDAVNPGSFGTGASAIITQNTSSGSFNGIGVASTLPSSEIYTMAFSLRPLNLTGDFVIGVGAGSSFTGNSNFSTSQGLFWLQSDSGNFERRTSSTWANIGGGTTLSLDTNYLVHVIANGSAAAVSYTGGSVAAGTMDIYLNGTLLDDDVTVTTSGLSANAFRMYNVNLGNMGVDDITLWNEAVAPVPEPSTYALLALSGLALAGCAARRRNRQK